MSWRSAILRWACLSPILAGLAACSSGQPELDSRTGAAPIPDILAGNAFYYYRDVDAAWAFYRDVLGLETVVDYGFARILRVAEGSYLTVVDAEEGMHSADEPHAVTFAFITEQVEEWYDYLSSAGVEMHAELRVEDGRAHDGFVAVDPEGYLLEFERFNPHEENVALLPLLADLPDVGPTGGERPAHLGIRGSVLWTYYDDLDGALGAYEDLLGRDHVLDQGWAYGIHLAGGSLLGLVDGARGLHQASVDKAVTVSFFTSDVDGWFTRVHDRIPLRTPEVTDESGRVRVFVGYGPENTFLEWDTFLDLPDNRRLLEWLGIGPGP